jgi:hypothetical protein
VHHGRPCSFQIPQLGYLDVFDSEMRLVDWPAERRIRIEQGHTGGEQDEWVM